jgi:glycosyltransferase involved in cell wall biosynthesis
MNFVIVAPTRSDNSLGRALSLAEAYRETGSVRLLAGNDGPLWQGARDSEFTIESFSSPAELGDAIATSAPNAVVAVKPFRRSLHWTVKALRRAPHAGQPPALVVDIDDYDAAIHAAWHRDLPPITRGASLIRSELSPVRIRARIRWLLPAADMLTVSSWALRSVLPRFRGPELRIPHPRPAGAYAAPAPAAERLRVGFFGTPVTYKGIGVLMQLIRDRPGTELHVLDGTQTAFASLPNERLVVHPHRGADTLALAFRHVDVVVLPQDPSEPAARYQLPAKLIDALRFGRPVVATDTPAIREIAGPSVALVPSWERLDAGLAALERFSDRARREALGREGAEAWARTFSAQALARQLASGFENVGAA